MRNGFVTVNHEYEVKGMSENQEKFNWEAALESVEHGEMLSEEIGFGFSDEDIVELAKLHKANKCRDKIVELLVDCNFITEAMDFAEQNYEAYL